MKKQFNAICKAVDEKGTGSAVFATLNKIDLDGDVTLPGAFGNDQVAKFVAAHDWKAPNIGSCKIHESGNDAIADFALYLDMPSAKEWHASLQKNFESGVPQEFSYGFDVIDSEKGMFDGKPVRLLKKMKVFEVSPVMVGAGIGTRLTAIKDAKALSGSWEATQEALRNAAFELLVPINAATGERDGWCSLMGTYRDRVVVSVWMYSGSMEDKYYEYDWTMETDGAVTLANQREVALETVVREKSVKLEDQFARVLGDTHSLYQRSKALAALRVKEGRTLSQANRDRLSRLLEALSSAQGDIGKLLEDTAPADTEKTMNLYADFLRTKARMDGLIRGANA